MMLKIFVLVCLTALLFLNDAQCNQKRIRKENQTQLLIDGIDINKISDEDLNGLFNAEDEKLTGELDIWIGKQTLKEKQRLRRIPPVIVAVGTRVVWSAGRHIMKTLIRNTLPKTEGNVRQYFKRGGYKSAQGDFWRFKPSNVKRRPKKGGQEVITGEILDGKYTLIVRKTSTYPRIRHGRPGRPTLELRSNIGGELVRKVRYEDRWSYRHQKHEYKYKDKKLSGRLSGIRRSKSSRTWSRGISRHGRIGRSRASRTGSKRRSRRGRIGRSRSSRTRRRSRSRRGRIGRSRSSRTRRRSRSRRGRIGRSRSSRTRRRSRSRRGRIGRSRSSRTRRRSRSRRGRIGRSRSSRTRRRSRSRRGRIGRSRSSRTRRRSRFRRGRIGKSRSPRTRSRSRARRGRIGRSRSFRTRSRSRTRRGKIGRSRSSRTRSRSRSRRGRTGRSRSMRPRLGKSNRRAGNQRSRSSRTRSRRWG